VSSQKAAVCADKCELVGGAVCGRRMIDATASGER